MSTPEPPTETTSEPARRDAEMGPVLAMTWVAFPFGFGILAAVIGLGLECDSSGGTFLALCCALPACLGLAAGVLWPAKAGIKRRIGLRIAAATGGLIVSAGCGLVFAFAASFSQCWE